MRGVADRPGCVISFERGDQVNCRPNQEHKEKNRPKPTFFFVPSVGIEPTLPAPEAGVLSIKRRGRKRLAHNTIFSFKNQLLDIKTKKPDAGQVLLFVQRIKKGIRNEII